MASENAAITMVRDDEFFLRKWVEYYGGQFGRENLYVVNHGHEEMVYDVASGCNIMGLPGTHHKGFDNKRWRLLNGLASGLRNYFRHVIVGDVDEFVVCDPDKLGSLEEFLANKKTNRVLTPIGLDLVHRRKDEPDPLIDQVLGPRRFVQYNPYYSKPCVTSTACKISRGGHYATHSDLATPEGLYLIHLKHCDYNLYGETLDRRNLAVEEIRKKRAYHIMMGAHWFQENRQDEETFEGFEAAEVASEFDLTGKRQEMFDSWEKRGDTEMYHFKTTKSESLFELPERFFGIF